jgi:glycosyltransferase involved in cell wall biosynthesis
LHNFKSKSPKIAGIHTELFWQKKLQLSYGTLASLFYLFNKVYHLADLRQFDAVHSITSAYPINHPHVYFIHNFVDSQFYVPKNNKEDKFTVTYASRMVWQKGWDKFQEVAKQLEQYDINVKVSSGKVQESDMPSFLSSAHVVVVPSRVDTFGILIVEALMTGTFVITTSLKTHQFLELPLIYADSVEENVAQIIRLKELWESNKEKYYELATLGRTSALKYDKKVIVDKLEKMFSEVASNTHQNSEFTEM